MRGVQREISQPLQNRPIAAESQRFRKNFFGRMTHSIFKRVGFEGGMQLV